MTVSVVVVTDLPSTSKSRWVVTRVTSPAKVSARRNGAPRVTARKTAASESSSAARGWRRIVENQSSRESELGKENCSENVEISRDAALNLCCGYCV